MLDLRRIAASTSDPVARNFCLEAVEKAVADSVCCLGTRVVVAPRSLLVLCCCVWCVMCSQVPEDRPFPIVYGGLSKNGKRRMEQEDDLDEGTRLQSAVAQHLFVYVLISCICSVRSLSEPTFCLVQRPSRLCHPCAQGCLVLS